MASRPDDFAVQVLERLEEPVVPDPEFADALLELLLTELGEPSHVPERRRWHVTRVRLAAAVALTLLAVLATAVLVLRTAEESALAAIRSAQRQAAVAPPFRAVVSHRVGGELALGTVGLASTGADWVSVSELSYGGEDGWKRRIVRDSFAPAARRVVWDGRVLGIDRPDQRRYYVFLRARARVGAERLSPLTTLSPRFRLFPVPATVAPATYFRERCSVGGEEQIAGRPARRLTCGDRGFRFSIWLDRENGLLLKLVSPGDVLEVQRIEYGVRFARVEFRSEPPPDATVVRIGGRR